MGNKQCCEVDSKEYQPTYSQQDQNNKITAVKIQTTPQPRLEQKQPEHATHAQNHPNIQQHPETEIKIEVVMQQEPIRLPQLTHEVQSRLQQYHALDQLIEAHKEIKEFGKEVYVGQLDKEKGIPHGQGKIYKTDGSIYLGQWIKGKAHGKGIYIKKDGSFYEGELQLNNAHGNGKFVSIYLIYEGSFKNNKFQGDGVEKGNAYSFQGQYQAGYKIRGVLVWKVDKDQYEYRGQFNSKSQFHGEGVLKEPKGIYDGEFKDGEKHGKGEYKFENGLKYIGEYSDGKKCGKGIIYNCNNTIAYEGEFEDDLPHGEGAIYDEKGVKTKRKWVRGIDVQGL